MRRARAGDDDDNSRSIGMVLYTGILRKLSTHFADKPDSLSEMFRLRSLLALLFVVSAVGAIYEWPLDSSDWRFENRNTSEWRD